MAESHAQIVARIRNLRAQAASQQPAAHQQMVAQGTPPRTAAEPTERPADAPLRVLLPEDHPVMRQIEGRGAAAPRTPSIQAAGEPSETRGAAIPGPTPVTAKRLPTVAPDTGVYQQPDGTLINTKRIPSG